MKLSNNSVMKKASILSGMILFELIYKLFIWAIIWPVFRFILTLTLTVSGYQLVFNDFIVGFLFTIPGIIAAVILLILAVICTYFEFAVLIYISGYRQQGKRFNPSFLLGQVGRSFRNIVHPCTLFFALYSFGLLPLAGVGFASSLLPSLSIPNFITGELQKNPWGTYLLTAVMILLFVLFLISLFALPIMVLQKQNFGKAFINSLVFARQHGKKNVGLYLILIGVKTISSILPGDIFMGVLAGVVQAVVLPVLLYFIISRYNAAGGEMELTELVKETAEQSFSLDTIKKMSKRSRLVTAVIAGVLLLTFGGTMLRIFNKPPSLHQPIVVGHRGSAYGVENTLEALQGAIDAGAEYAEVDILLSADGIPMVIHDSNLNRLTGEDVNVYDLTAEELKRLTLSQNGYTGYIPTLEEVINYCQGKIGLTVEIKLHGKEEADVVEETISLLQQNNYLEDCMFISLEYTLIEEINTRYPEAVAGYCVYGNVGSLKSSILMDMEIDFLVIEESMATSSNIYDFRGGWLPVYVWTVNDADNMQRYLDMGAIGIVSDYPDTGRKVVDDFIKRSGKDYLDESQWRD